MRRGWIGTVMGAVLAVASVLPATAETLTDALIAAYRNSNLLEQNRAVLRAADEDVASAVSTLRPVLGFAVNSRYNFNNAAPNTAGSITSTLDLTASITLFDFGRNQLAVAAAKETVLATRQTLVGIEHRVLLDAVNAYTNIRLQQDTVALRESNVRVIERELRAAQDRFELGEITRTDVAIAEARLAGARNNLSSAQGDLAIAREQYNLAVGRYPGRLTAPPRAPQTARSLDEARAIARRTHYDIRGAQHQLAAAELNVARANAAMKPSFGLSSQVQLNDRGRTSGSIGFQATQPIYQGGRLSAELRKSMAQRDATRAALQQRAAEVDRQVGDAWARVAIATSGIEASERQIRAARTAYEGIREEATLGARTTLDVLNAEQELLDAEFGRISAITAQYNATYALLAAMGLLTVDHLRLGIPTYDVTGYYNAVKDAPTVTSPQGQRLDRVLRATGN